MQSLQGKDKLLIYKNKLPARGHFGKVIAIYPGWKKTIRFLAA
jgi:hypothetical protein